MSVLAAWQRDFQARVLHGAVASSVERLAAAPDGQLPKRLHVYERAYESRLVEALGRTYAALRRGLGPGPFAALAAEFVRATPSRHRSIRDYGGELGAFIARRDAGDATRAWAELAAWQWTLTDVFDAPDGPSLRVESVAAVRPEGWGSLRFSLHPTVRRFRTTTNAVELWRHYDPEADATAVTTVVPVPSAAPAVEWLIWRRELTTSFRSLDGVEAQALQALSAGASFADLCGQLAAVEGDAVAPLRAAQLLRGWIESGLIAGP
jgi:hypothetical protein